MLKVAITSPSLDPASNISGISNHTRLVIESHNHVAYTHITVGKRDQQRRNIHWVLSQARVVTEFAKGIKSADLVHLNIPLANLAIAVNVVLSVVAKLRGKKIVAHFRGGELSLRSGLNILQRAAISIFIKVSSAVIVLGSRERDFLIETHGRRLESKIHVLPNAVLLRDIDPATALRKFSGGRLQLTYFGRMDLAKGLADIVEALDICSGKFEFHFHAIGAGPDLPELDAMLSEHQIRRYTIHGSKTQDQLLSIIEGCHLFLLPSHYEGLPNSLLEAMANYVVPVVTPVGAIPEVVGDLNNGFLVPVKEPAALAKTLCIAAADRDLLGDMAHRGRRLMEQSFSIDSYCDRLLAIYRQAHD